MIIIKLMGGMGNQLFQYATARRVAHSLSVPLKLDLTWFSNIEAIDSPRQYELKAFNIVEEFASNDEVASLRNVKLKGLTGIFRKLLDRTIFPHSSSWVREKHFHFDPDILKLHDNIYLEGYWQSEKYFIDIKDILYEEFTIKTGPGEANRAKMTAIVNTDAVALHVRRGDYVLKPEINKYHGTCPIEYYQQAIELISKQIRQPRLFIFSDDHDWVKNNFKLTYSVTFMDQNGPANAFEDLRLMSLCKHHIIANSSFSWWGAWLCKYPRKIVIGPKKWFNNPAIDTSDLLPEHWIRI